MRSRAHRARPLPRRGRRQPQPRSTSDWASRWAGHGTFSNSITIYFRADVAAAVRRSQPERDLRLRAPPAGVLPLLEGGRCRLSRRQHGHRRRRQSLHRPLDGHFRGALRGIRARGARRTRPRRSRSRTCSGGTRVPNGRRSSSTGACSSQATQRTTCPPPAASAATRASRTVTTSRGSSRSCSSGTAGPELLSTYDAERRPVAELTVEQAYTRYVLRLAPELGKENLQPIVPEATVELGYRYRSDAVLLEADGDDAVVEDPHAPSARPGTRAPHLVVNRDGAPSRYSTSWAGLRRSSPGERGERWCDAARAAASAARLSPLDAYRVASDGDLVDDEGRFAELYGTGAGGSGARPSRRLRRWRARAADD